jgi:hypothetical protein
MITFDGLFVPSITIVLPFGGAELSGVVMLICVGNALYGASAAAAALVEAEPPELPVDAAFEALEPPDDDELEELDEPQAASARASIRVPAIARYPRARSRLLLRRSSLESCVMLSVSFRS